MRAQQEGDLRRLSFEQTRSPIEKFVIPEGIEDLLVKWHSPEYESDYSPEISCAKCDSALQLTDIRFEWQLGPVVAYFPRTPGYECKPCNRRYFPESVREDMAMALEKEVKKFNPEPVRNPKAIVFHARYRDSFNS